MDRTRPELPGAPSDHLAETIDLTPTTPEPEPSASPERTPESEDRPVEVIEGSADLSDETRDLLRVRLRAVAIILLAGLVAFFLRDLALEPVAASRELVLLSVVHVVVIGLMAAAVVLLTRRRSWSMPQLRAVEASVFGGVLVFLAAVNFDVTSDAIRRGDLVVTQAMDVDASPTPEVVRALVDVTGDLVASVKASIIFTLILMVLYGLFIPNPPRRAAAAVFLIALGTGLMQAGVMFRSAGHLALLVLLRDTEKFTSDILTILMGGLIAIYGSWMINALRVEAFEARRLGQYVLRRRLGVGGMGEVFLAEHRMLKRPCALKLIRPDRAGDPVALRRFEREVRATAGLSHWNTVDIYDYGRTEDGTFYYVMEYLRGLPLDDLLERHGPLPVGRVVYLLRQACESLAEAHAAGLVHRDLKPANIFAAARGGRFDVAKVLDFGLVKTVGPDPGDSAAAAEAAVAGTPLFMAPEQADGGDRVGPASDLYALGAVAYAMLIGRPPHVGNAPAEVLRLVLGAPVTPPSEFRPDVPADLERVVLRCLSRNPVDRYASAGAMARALASCACNADWDARRAADWWRDHEPEVFDPKAV